MTLSILAFTVVLSESVCYLPTYLHTQLQHEAVFSGGGGGGGGDMHAHYYYCPLYSTPIAVCSTFYC